MLSVQALMQEAHVRPERTRGDRRLSRGEERRVMATLIDELPETARLVLGLRYCEALRPRQIATVLGLSEEEIRKVLSEALLAVESRLRALPPETAASGRRRGAALAAGREGRSA